MFRGYLTPLCLIVCLALPVVVLADDAPDSGGLLAREPGSPEEQFDAALTMLKLARPKLAAQYLDALLASDPDDATLFAIRDKHGTATFVQLSRIEALQPASQTLLEKLNTAARNQLDDPAFQESLLQRLTAPTLRERQASLNSLRALGDDAVPLVIRRIAAGATPDEEVFLMQSLLQLGRRSIAPLIATLDSDQDHVRTVAADLLGRLEADAALLPLSVVAFDDGSSPALRDAARRSLARIQYGDVTRAHQVSSLRLTERLKHQALQCFRDEIELASGDDGLVRQWDWNNAAGTVQLATVDQSAAAARLGERTARAALRLAEQDAEAQALLLGHRMWLAILAAGWDQPIPTGPGTTHDLALALSPELVRDVLQLGLKHENSAAALTSLKVLAQTGSRGELLASGSPLLAALNASESRLQFAAAETVMQLDPHTTFPGASRVVEILARSLNGTPQARSVVVDPNTRRGARLAGLISTLGFDSGLAQTGQEGFQMATSEGSVELAVLHLNTVRWELSQTIANLRADPRTRRLPIAVYGPSELRGSTRHKLHPYQLVSYLDDAGDPGLLRDQLTPLIGQRQVPELTEDQRRAEIASAAFWLRHIADGQRTQVFPLESAESALSRAIGQTVVARDALVALGAIGKPSVQQRIAEVALSDGFAVETRRAAIVQLAFHVQRFGRMIDNPTAQAIANAYRAETSPELRSAWAAVVGALRPDRMAATTQLLSSGP